MHFLFAFDGRSRNTQRNMARWIATSVVSLLVLQLLSLAESSHFRYGTIAWAPTNPYSNTVEYLTYWFYLVTLEADFYSYN